MNRQAMQSLNALGHSLVEAGHNLVDFTNAMFAELDQPKPKPPGDKYSQAAKDARQYPILALFAPLNPTSQETLPWDGPGSVTEIAFNNGYTTKSVGALLMTGGLLQWVDAGKTVTITDKGRVRFREIEARHGTLMTQPRS
jgi:hypothetical protein